MLLMELPCLEASRRIWRQLTLLEDAMMAYRIVRLQSVASSMLT